MKKLFFTLLAAAAIAVGLAAPASAHEYTCSYGEHYSGHSSYLMVYRYSFKSYDGSNWHHTDKMINKNFWGNYTTRAYSIDVRC